MCSLEKPTHPLTLKQENPSHIIFTMKLLLKMVSFSACMKKMYCSQEEALFL